MLETDGEVIAPALGIKVQLLHHKYESNLNTVFEKIRVSVC
jgi:hypothetical protein